MARLIKVIAKNCGECPYSEYDPNYGMSYNCGYDCNLTGNRIANDIGGTEPDLTKIPIPSWCELPEVDDVVLSRKEKLEKILKNI